jgi:hypothetical protein
LPLEQRLLQLHQAGFHFGQFFQQPQAEIRRYLVIAAAPGVQLAAQRADQLLQPALDGAVNIFVFFQEDEFNLFDFNQDGLQPFCNLDGFAGLQHASLFKRLCPGQAAAHILPGQASVKRQRGVQAPGQGIQFAAEAALHNGMVIP